MKTSRLPTLFVVLLLVVSACVSATPTAVIQPTATPEAMMNATATPDAMMNQTVTPDAMMNATATPDAMMNTTATPDAMMNTTVTPDAMMNATVTPDAMMNATATPDAMMKTTATPDAMMKATATPDAMMNATATPDAMMNTTATPGAMMAPAWVGATLTDVVHGKPFTLHDFKGKVVLVEPIALGSAASLQQQAEIKALLAKPGALAGLVVVALDVTPSDPASALQAYAAKNGFDWTYAVAPAVVTGELGRLYGAQFQDPAAGALLVVDAKGDVHPLPLGLENAERLGKTLQAYAPGM